MGWLNGWTYRKSITILNTHVLEDLIEFPLCVKIKNDTDVGVVSVSGLDIRFTEADGETLLKHELDKFTATNNIANATYWVNTNIPSTGKKIYMYYGGSAIDVSTTGTWNYGYTGVWHCNNGNDSTVYANHMIPSGSVSVTNGLFGSAYDITPNGSGHLYRATQIVGSTNPNSLTITGWIKLRDITNTQRIIYCGQTTGANQANLQIVAGRLITQSVNSTSNIASGPSTVFFPSGEWCFFAGQYYINEYRFSMVNEKRSTTTVNKNMPAAYGNSAIGCEAKTVKAFFLDAIVDEIRVSRQLKTYNWLLFEYYNGISTTNELTWGAQKSLGSIIKKAIESKPLNQGSVIVSEGVSTKATVPTHIAATGILNTRLSSRFGKYL